MGDTLIDELIQDCDKQLRHCDEMLMICEEEQKRLNKRFKIWQGKKERALLTKEKLKK